LGGLEQSGLIVAKNQTVVTPLLVEDLMHRLVLGVHAIQLHHLSVEIQRWIKVRAVGISTRWSIRLTLNYPKIHRVSPPAPGLIDPVFSICPKLRQIQF
jgi:hypothetical protein